MSASSLPRWTRPMSNTARQAQELEALQGIFLGDGEFELLGDGPAEGQPVSFRLRVASSTTLACSVLITLPPGYPSEDSPTFVVEGFKAARSATLAESMGCVAQERLGEECVFEAVQSLEALLGEEEEEPAEAQTVATEEPEAGPKSNWGWAAASGSGTVLQVSVRSGAKVKTTQFTNLSELRRLPQTGALCIDLQPSRNTENYELARLLASCLRVPENEVEFIVGGKKEKASGERQVQICGLAPKEAVSRVLASS